MPISHVTGTFVIEARTLFVIAASLAVVGCATHAADEETLSVCVDLLPAADGWVRVGWRDAEARSLDRKFPTAPSRDISGKDYPEKSFWFRNSGLAQYAACARESCGVDDCYWQVRNFVRDDGQWVEFSEHTAVIYYSE
jgi:hypothetical protein